ncbi:MAG: cytochrome P460 family protein [Bradyrhizobium sp.]
MKQFVVALFAVGLLTGLIGYDAPASGQNAPIPVPNLPSGYRDWPLISVAHEEGKLNDLRAILGNKIAIKAARAGTLPYPDGTIIARLAWDYHPLEESKAAFGNAQSFVAVSPKNGVQFMVKDAKKYASTGGWGYIEFDDGKPSTKAMPVPALPATRPSNRATSSSTVTRLNFAAIATAP